MSCHGSGSIARAPKAATPESRSSCQTPGVGGCLLSDRPHVTGPTASSSMPSRNAMNDASSGEPLSSGGDQSDQAEDDQQASTGHGHERADARRPRGTGRLCAQTHDRDEQQGEPGGGCEQEQREHRHVRHRAVVALRVEQPLALHADDHQHSRSGRRSTRQLQPRHHDELPSIPASVAGPSTVGTLAPRVVSTDAGLWVPRTADPERCASSAMWMCCSRAVTTVEPCLVPGCSCSSTSWSC